LCFIRLRANYFFFPFVLATNLLRILDVVERHFSEPLLCGALYGECRFATTNAFLRPNAQQFRLAHFLLPSVFTRLQIRFKPVFKCFLVIGRLKLQAALQAISLSLHLLQHVSGIKCRGHMNSSWGIYHIPWEFHMGCWFQNPIGHSFRNAEKPCPTAGNRFG
jgi:hypothetical protein